MPTVRVDGKERKKVDQNIYSGKKTDSFPFSPPPVLFLLTLKDYASDENSIFRSRVGDEGAERDFSICIFFILRRCALPIE